MTAVAPARSIEQRMAALENAQRIRLHRAQCKRDLAAGRIALVKLFDDPLCANMKVWDAILALPKYGRAKVGRFFTRNAISPSKTFGGMSDRQRDALLADLGERAIRTAVVA